MKAAPSGTLMVPVQNSIYLMISLCLLLKSNPIKVDD